MGKIKKFTRKAAELDAIEAFNEIAYMHTLLESREALIRHVIEDSKERLKPVNREIGKLELVEDNFLEQIRDNGYPIAFLFHSESGYDYTVTLTEAEEGEDASVGMVCILTHPLRDGTEVYDWENQKWIVVDSGGKWVEDVLEEGGARAAFLEYMLDMEPEDSRLTEESFSAMCGKHKPLLDLCGRLDGLVDFDYVFVNAGRDGVTGLIPADDVFGIAVLYEDGKFRILQQLEDTYICLACDQSGAEYPENDFLHVPVYTCDDVEEAEKALRLMLDHFYQEETFVFPLSDRHYIRTPNPFLDLKTVMGSEEELTDKEKMRMRYLANFFRQ